ncbi:hypothetical protein FIBSPDRAFT_942878 [Athelia psychrophila]|uniref:O-methyltransferase C-terminal domain-containing protein n=1 Tax=Athelia psychrophila TaxID=1759441 RepID=A0A166WGZ6_9AGAM|nr:hypothetical protein FIBSPDRAFT_942878 [Fibularhizoctonia sp. CBS 109695]
MVVPKNSFSHLEPTYPEVAIKANIAGILVDHLDGLSPDIGTNADIHPEKLGQSVCFLATKNCLKKFVRIFPRTNGCRLSSLVARIHRSDYFLPLGLSESPDKPPLLCNIKAAGQSNFYEWLKDNPDREALFGSAMVGMNEISRDSDMLVENYPFDRLPKGATVCDVGGGIGGISVAIANVYLHMVITLQDQPILVEQGRQARAVGGWSLLSADSAPMPPAPPGRTNTNADENL